MKKPIILIIVLLIIAALSVWIWHHNKTVVTTHYTVSSENLPESFDGFTVVQVSDLHNDEIGKSNIRLIDAIKAASPDIIVLTGDIMDSYRTDLNIACEFIDGIVDIAPVYYITGNHEYRFPLIFEKFESHMTDAGVIVLRDKTAEIELGGETVSIVGVEDPDFSGIEGFKDSEYFALKLIELVPDDGFTLLLSHRPDIFETYCRTGADLVLTGHAHGGQFRLPLLGGLFAPQQGFLPDYSEGIFEKDGTAMIISRGLGNSAFPFRINNPPELVVVTLETK